MSLRNLNCFFFLVFKVCLLLMYWSLLAMRFFLPIVDSTSKRNDMHSSLWTSRLIILLNFLEGLGLFFHIMLIWFWINLCLLIPKLKLICNVIAILFLTYLSFKACVRYFFFFFHQMIALQELWTMLFFIKGLGSKEEIKLTILGLFDNPLSRCLIFNKMLLSSKR